MNEEQWVFIYQKIKNYILNHTGVIPGDKTAEDIIKLKDWIFEITDKSRHDNPAIDTELSIIFDYLFKIIHALEVEDKQL